MTETTGYEFYLAPGQQYCDSVVGVVLEKHLKETRLIDRAFSLDDELIKGWIANPETYPENFKGRHVILWKSKRVSDDGDTVAYLYWTEDGPEEEDSKVIVLWFPLNHSFSFGNYFPALLHQQYHQVLA